MSQYYKKYMKKREEEKPSYFKLFIGAFLVVIVFSAIFMTHSLLSVDTSIGENDEGDIKESGLGVKHLIDSRLRFIKMEDESAVAPAKEKSANIEQYGKFEKEETDMSYNGHYQNSYGYTPPQSQTQTSGSAVQTQTVKTVNPALQQPKPATPNIKTVPTPEATQTKTYSSPHNVQKNLVPTGMN